jgi:hypothetical protein
MVLAIFNTIVFSKNKRSDYHRVANDFHRKKVYNIANGNDSSTCIEIYGEQ